MQQIDKENLQIFGKLIRSIRQSKSDSLNKIAFTRGGITSATLSRIENGLVDFKFSTLIKLAYLLDIPLKDLITKYNYKQISDEE